MKPTGFLPRLALTPVLLSFTACAVGPNYQHPAPPKVALAPGGVPAQTASADGQAQHFLSGADIAGDWWTLYRSPELDALIQAGLANSPTLAAAQATLVEAEENLRAGQGAFFPSLSASFQDSRQRVSSAEFASFGGTGSTASNAIVPPYTLYNASLAISYTPDVFGATRRNVESLAAQAEYQRYQLEAAYLTLSANIVTAAITEASLQAQIDATNKVVGAERHLLDILRRQVGFGGVAEADVLQQQATLASSEATLAPLQSQLAQARNQLATYVGKFPGDFHAQDFTLAALSLPQNLPVSLPSAIVAQRPDIAAAAAQLHQATAAVGVATANMLPQISLSANVGHESLDLGSLFSPSTLLWSLVAGVTQPIFEGGTLAAQRKSAIAAMQAAGAQYQGTVINAFQNVADTLAALQYDAVTLSSAEAAAAAAQRSLSVTQNAYTLGGQPLTAVLTAQTTYQNAEISAVKARATRLADTAALFQALGGGWWNRKDVASACCGIVP